MYLKRINEELSIYYLSNNNTGLGNTLIEDTLENILSFVNTVLISQETDFQLNAIFEIFPNGGVVTTISGWYAMPLNSDLWQIIKTEDMIKTSLPKCLTITGSLTDVINHIYDDIVNN